ncbi:MAG: PhnA domain-containing protein [Candidatus Sericytochromatia bacterium]|nr:PhnA domain-containing protein [Candidatus Sericytochromatia bacterium]
MAKGLEEHQARLDELNQLGKGLARRAKSSCELCGASSALQIFEVPPVKEPNLEASLLICETCAQQLKHPDALDSNHWFGLQERIWSEVPAVQVMAWRLLQELKDQTWAQDLLDQVYLADEVLHWAQMGAESDASGRKTFDSNGTALADGDNVHIIKDLDVKGTTFTAKRGTLVKAIRLGEDPELVEGKVNGTSIMLKTCFLKKV